MLAALTALLLAKAAATGTLDTTLPMPSECLQRSGGCRLTANGWWPSECVHNVPSGSAVKAWGRGVHITYPNGTVDRMADCAARLPAETLARLQQRRQQRRSGGAPAQVSEGQFGAYPIMWEYGIDPKTAPMNHWEGTYHVGDHPTTGAGGSFWVGLEPYSCDSVMQAVTYFTTSGWFVVSENCCPGGHDFRVGEVKVNDTSMPIHGVVQRVASTEHIDPAACTTNGSIKTAVCNSGATQKVPGSDKGSMLSADCAAICESNKFAATLGSCLGWSVVPSTVPAGLRRYQGCYLSNTSWDGTRGACPYYADSSGCSSRGVTKYAAECCGASPTAYVINTTVNNKTFTLEGDNGKAMNIPLTVLELYNGDYQCSDLPSSVSATNLVGTPYTFFGKIKDYTHAKCNWTVHGDNASSSASAPKGVSAETAPTELAVHV